MGTAVTWNNGRDKISQGTGRRVMATESEGGPSTKRAPNENHEKEAPWYLHVDPTLQQGPEKKERGNADGREREISRFSKGGHQHAIKEKKKS